METIFDFNPTKDDLFDILSYPNADAEWYRKSFSPDTFVMHLCFLFHVVKKKMNCYSEWPMLILMVVPH